MTRQPTLPRYRYGGMPAEESAQWPSVFDLLELVEWWQHSSARELNERSAEGVSHATSRCTM